jgi:putative aldouronate transport system permease protein
LFSKNDISRRRFRFDTNQAILQVMALLGITWFLVFIFTPYYGLTLAFREYDFARGFFGSPWIGFQYFKEIFTDPEIPNAFINTLAISVLKLLICFPAPIILALLLNELPGKRFKSLVQTVSYFPHFISWVIISLIAIYWLSPDIGIINKALMSLHLVGAPITPLTDAGSYWIVAVISEVWKETGWGAIIYIAAITGIDETLYEAASVDGISKIGKIIYITIPGISGTILILLLLNIGSLLSNANFDQSYFMGNAMNYDRSNILDTYVLKVGVSLGRFSYATAVGLLKSLISLVLLLGSNIACRKLFGRTLYMEEED